VVLRGRGGDQRSGTSNHGSLPFPVPVLEQENGNKHSLHLSARATTSPAN
jgi:hypothetical protein